MFGKLVFAAFYTGAAAACIAAWLASRDDDRPGHEARGWIVNAVLFAAILAWRMLDLESGVQAHFREALRADGSYGERREFQGMLLAGAALVSLALAAIAWRMRPPASAGRAAEWYYGARLAVLGFLPLIAMRLISLHSLDKVLYARPIHPNWLIEGGLCTLAGFAALRYRWLVMQRRRHRNHPSAAR